jgi:phage shock protein E
MNKFLFTSLFALVTILIGAVFFMTSMKSSNTNVLGVVSVFSDLTPQQFDSAIKSGQYELIDVRTLDEYNAGHIKGAKQEDFYQTQALSNYLDTLDKNGKYLIYCHTGNRSGLTLGLMQQKGFATVYDLAGGYNAWVSSGFPTEK